MAIEVLQQIPENRSIIGRYNIDKGVLKIVWEREKPKNLHA